MLALAAAGSCGFKHKKFENPIVAETDQPDKILFDKAVKDIEKGAMRSRASRSTRC